jgi:hypothetical protein
VRRKWGEEKKASTCYRETMERGVSFLLCDLQKKPWRETREKTAERQRRQEHYFLIVKGWLMGQIVNMIFDR